MTFYIAPTADLNEKLFATLFLIISRPAMIIEIYNINNYNNCNNNNNLSDFHRRSAVFRNYITITIAINNSSPKNINAHNVKIKTVHNSNQ